MIITYYAIREYDEPTCSKGPIVLEGVATSSHEIIYPQHNADNKDLPVECPINGFHAEGYTIEVTSFHVDRETAKRRRTTGDHLKD